MAKITSQISLEFTCGESITANQFKELKYVIMEHIRSEMAEVSDDYNFHLTVDESATNWTCDNFENEN